MAFELKAGEGYLNRDQENPEKFWGSYKLSKDMESYSYSDKDLSILFKESLELSKDDIEQHLEEHPEINFDDVIFTVFHAGIGQDFVVPFLDSPRRPPNKPLSSSSPLFNSFCFSMLISCFVKVVTPLVKSVCTFGLV